MAVATAGAGIRRAAVFTLAAVMAASCVTASEGEAMRAEQARLKTRLDEMEARYARATQDMERLRQVVDEANALLTRNSADLGARVEQQDADLREIKGLLEEARHLIDQLKKQQDDQVAKLAEQVQTLDDNQQKLIERVAPTIPEDKEELWKAANAKLNAGMRDDARRFFKSFVSRFPQDPRAAAARLAIGKSYALDDNHRLAAGNFQKVLDDYPKSPLVPEAMFELGRSFVALKFCGDARAIFLDLARRYRRSPFSRQARQQAAAVKRIMRDATRCTS